MLLRAKPTQASALTHDSNLSGTSPGRDSASPLALVPWMRQITVSSGSMLENNSGHCGESFGCLKRGETQLDLRVAVVIPRRSWTESYLMLHFSITKSKRHTNTHTHTHTQTHTHTHTQTHIHRDTHPGRSDLLSENVACQALDDIELFG